MDSSLLAAAELEDAGAQDFNTAPLHVWFKCENQQRGGSFKIRGALTSVIRELEARCIPPFPLSTDEGSDDCRKRKLITAITESSGNHGAALAIAAAMCGIKCNVICPQNAPTVKKKAMESYGAQLTFCQGVEDRESTMIRVMNNLVNDGFECIVVPPYNSLNTIAGQGTCALEIIRDLPSVDCIVTPIGGGGLISGTILVAKENAKSIDVVGAEPIGANDCLLSLKSDTMRKCDNIDTLCDGLRAPVKDITFGIIRKHITAVVTASDCEVIIAMRLLFERMKIVVEPSGSIGLACCLSPHFVNLARRRKWRNIVVVLSGGNFDFDLPLPWTSEQFLKNESQVMIGEIWERQ